jgi:hypothetical protein
MTINDNDNNNTIREITITITMARKTAKTTVSTGINMVIVSAYDVFF